MSNNIVTTFKLHELVIVAHNYKHGDRVPNNRPNGTITITTSIEKQTGHVGEIVKRHDTYPDFIMLKDTHHFIHESMVKRLTDITEDTLFEMYLNQQINESDYRKVIATIQATL